MIENTKQYSKQSLCLSLVDSQEVFHKTNIDTYHSRQRPSPKPKKFNKCLKQIQYHPSRPTPRPRPRPYFPRLRSTLDFTSKDLCQYQYLILKYEDVFNTDTLKFIYRTILKFMELVGGLGFLLSMLRQTI